MRHRSHHHSFPVPPALWVNVQVMLTKSGQLERCVRWGVRERREPFQAALPEVRAVPGDPSTQSPFLLPGAECKPVLWRAETEPANTSRNSGANAEGTSEALQLLNKMRIRVHFLGGGGG